MWLKHIIGESIEWISVLAASVFGNTLVRSAEAKKKPIHEAIGSVGQVFREKTQFDRTPLESALPYLNRQLAKAKPPRSSALQAMFTEASANKGVLEIGGRPYMENDITRWLNELVKARGKHVLIRLDKICEKSREEFMALYELQNNDGVRQHVELAKHIVAKATGKSAAWVDKKAEEAAPKIKNFKGIANFRDRLRKMKGGRR